MTDPAAKERMRKLRDAQGGSTLHDRAYKYALTRLREKHPKEFERYRMWFLNANGEGR